MAFRIAYAAMRTAAASLVGGALIVNCALALPPGRAWAPYAELRFSGTSVELGWLRLDRTSTGLPYMILPVNWDSVGYYRWTTFLWADTGWKHGAHSAVRTGGLPVFDVRPTPVRELVSLGTRDLQTLKTWLMTLPVAPESIGSADSVFATTAQSSDYAGAAWGRRRWAIRSEQVAPEFEWHVRVFYSDTARVWHEVERLGINEFNCTVGPLGDTTAMVVYAGDSGLAYAILSGSRWIEQGTLDSRAGEIVHPELRLRPSGGLWLFWADYDWMHMSSYRNGVWERGDSLQCIPNPGETFRPIFLDAELDSTEYPVLAWTNSGYGDTWRDVTAIAFGNGHGWDPGEEVPNSELSGWLEPTITTDRNGDVWVAWRRAREGTNRWTHTYCSATSSAPSVTAQGDGTRITWTLTASAPHSRWSVWRAEAEEGPFDSLGVVHAGEDSVLAFDDPTAFAGRTWRYRIRRESVDTRYVWTSDVASYQRADLSAPLGLALANPIADAQLSFQLTGAAGLLWARLYDLQGRQVLRERLVANGTGEDAFTLELGGSGARRPGIYFLRITDALGRQTRAARVAVIR